LSPLAISPPHTRYYSSCYNIKLYWNSHRYILKSSRQTQLYSSIYIHSESCIKNTTIQRFSIFVFHEHNINSFPTTIVFKFHNTFTSLSYDEKMYDLWYPIWLIKMFILIYYSLFLSLIFITYRCLHNILRRYRSIYFTFLREYFIH